MNILILGGNGMAGHVLVDHFRGRPDCTVHYTSRDPRDHDACRLEATNPAEVDQLLVRLQPDYVINAIGILNQKAEEHPGEARIVNSLLPHRIAASLDALGYGGKLVHISTDCVFSGEIDEADIPHPHGRSGSSDEIDEADIPAGSSDEINEAAIPAGRRGRYTEKSIPDGTSVYARTKAAGEVISEHHLTIRTSIIGPEIRQGGIGLFDWFMRQRGTISGYTRVLWNGVTTVQLAKAIEGMIEHNVNGLYHLTAPDIISKHDLLHLIAEIFEKDDVRILSADEPRLDRTLASTRKDYVAQVPPYREMLTELRDWMGSR